MRVVEIAMWGLRHIVLVWAGLFLVGGLLSPWLLEPKGPGDVPSPYSMLIDGTWGLFFPVYDLVLAIGLSDDGYAPFILSHVIVFGILVALDYGITVIRHRTGFFRRVKAMPSAWRWLLRHLFLVWGLLQFIAGLAVVSLELEYDAGGLMTLAFFLFWFLRQPTFIGQWLLVQFGVELGSTTWPYVSLIAGLVLWIGVDFLINAVLRHARPEPESRSIGSA